MMRSFTFSACEKPPKRPLLPSSRSGVGGRGVAGAAARGRALCGFLFMSVGQGVSGGRRTSCQQVGLDFFALILNVINRIAQEFSVEFTAASGAHLVINRLLERR